MSIKNLTILGCSSQQHTRLRNHGAYLLRWNQKGFLFDPGEGTQRQFIFANIAPTCVTHIFISHFHGDHCLGLSSMFMRLNLDKIRHPIHCYFPASGKTYFDRLRYSSLYHENIQIIEHPVYREGIVEETDLFRIEAFPLSHGIENFAWRITESDKLRFNKQKLQQAEIQGEMVQLLEKEGSLSINGKTIELKEVSYMQKGEVFAIVLDTLPCPGCYSAAKNASLLLCESTYLEKHNHLAKEYRHLTAKQAALIAKKSDVQKLILTHFSARYQILDLFEKEAREIFPNSYAADDLKTFSFPPKEEQ
jgi:ribonuclease Z